MSCCNGKKVVTSEKASKAIGPYSIGIVAGPFVYTSGQIGVDPATGEFVEGGVSAQTERALNNVKVILEAAGARMEDVVKTTVFLQHMDDFATMNAAYAKFFPENPPARSAIEVAKLPKGALVEIEVVAWLTKE